MKFFLEPASVEEIRQRMSFGVIREIATSHALTASTLRPLHVVPAARMGALIGTMPYRVSERPFKHPIPDKGIKNFLKGREKARETLGDLSETASARNPKR